MPKALNFTTDPSNEHLAFSLGNPVHDGVVPSARTDIRGVQVDGVPVEFYSESTPDQIHKALVDGTALEKLDIPFSCYTFSLIMAGINMRKACMGKDYVPDAEFSKQAVGLEYKGSVPLGLKIYMGWRYGEGFGHVVYPAHTNSEARYVHKLGDNGPICLSSPADSLQMYRGKSAHKLRKVTIMVGNKPRADWEEDTIVQPL